MCSCFTLTAQENAFLMGGEQPVKKYTIMERFEPEYILTATEREKLKAERFAEIQITMRVLDTMNISDRKREKLINDLMVDPFSPRLSKTMAEIRFKEDE